ncbi:MAG: rhomboid family intramembrane serine protease, partial [Puniceicoccaceae bacterium]
MTSGSRHHRPPDLVEAGRYRTLREAGEEGLAILAMGEAYWAFREDDEYVLCVRREILEAVRRELEACRRGKRKRPPPERLSVLPVRFFPFAIYGVVLAGFYCIQHLVAPSLAPAGRTDSLRIIEQGQWWRTLTALTLHADLPHLVSNLCGGIGFVYWLARYLGSAWAWTLVVCCGALGNALAAAIHYPEPHLSIGASTAVFAALGLLTGFGWAHTRGDPERSIAIPEWIIPPIAGLTLLGLLGGAGGPRTDVTAHICGFAAGIATALPVAAFGWERHLRS